MDQRIYVIKVISGFISIYISILFNMYIFQIRKVRYLLAFSKNYIDPYLFKI